MSESVERAQVSERGNACKCSCCVQVVIFSIHDMGSGKTRPVSLALIVFESAEYAGTVYLHVLRAGASGIPLSTMSTAAVGLLDTNKFVVIELHSINVSIKP